MFSSASCVLCSKACEKIVSLTCNSILEKEEPTENILIIITFKPRRLLRSSQMFGAWIVRQQEFSIHDDMLSSKQKSVELEPLEDFHANDVTTSQIIKNVASDAPPSGHTGPRTPLPPPFLIWGMFENVTEQLVFFVFCSQNSHYQNLYVWTLTYVYKKFSGNCLP